MSELEEAAEALRQSARKPGLPRPRAEHQIKQMHVAVRRLRIAAKKEQRR